MPERITLLGATGTVGKAATDFLQAYPEDFEIASITGDKNVARLAEIAKQLNPEFAALADESQWQNLKEAFNAPDMKGLKTKIAVGDEAILDAAQQKTDKVLAAIVGGAGLKPTLKAAEQGAVIALANKECLVMAGHFFMEKASKILPVDSEHNAIFQILDGKDNAHEISKLILTSSGGPFRDTPLDALQKVTASDAIKHPNWVMGKKISVDSATMMNKALELIEAYYLFNMPPEKLEILIHPQQIIHSMVEYCDGSVLAQLGVTDMYLPTAHALSYPHRFDAPDPYRLNLAEIGRLDFSPPDFDRFPALKLAIEIIKHPQPNAIIFNAGNEVAVKHFLAGKLGYSDIVPLLDRLLQKSQNNVPRNIDDVLAIDHETRILAEKYIANRK